MTTPIDADDGRDVERASRTEQREAERASRAEQREADADSDEREFLETPDERLELRRDAPLGDPEDRVGGRDE